MTTALRVCGIPALMTAVALVFLIGCNPPAGQPAKPPAGGEKSSAEKAGAGKAAATPAAADKAAATPSGSAKPVATPTAPLKAGADGWIDLFDGKTLTNWKITDFGGQGKVHVKDGQLIFEIGEGNLTGVTWAGGDIPRMNFEVACEAMRVEGGDFFCGLTFPYNDSAASLICGGWGGTLIGISSFDGYDAANNETAKMKEFENGKWYAIRVRVTAEHIEAWIGDEKVVDAQVNGRKVAVRWEVEPSQPLGLAAYATKAATRSIKVCRLPE